MDLHAKRAQRETKGRKERRDKPAKEQKPRACATVRVILNSESAGNRSLLLTSKGIADASAGVKSWVTSEITNVRK